MFRKIEPNEVDRLIAAGVGMFCEQGYIGESKPGAGIVIEGNLGTFVVPQDSFESVGAFGIRASDKLLKAIGGLPETEIERLARINGWDYGCAMDVWYLRTRSRWTQELESKLIQLHQAGTPPNINEFG